jgi:fermentation-respiration switch protein FrsA (DUF1100 family)
MLVAAALAAVAFALWLLLGAAERAVLFPGSFAAPDGRADVARYGGQEVWLEHPGGRSEAWLLPGVRPAGDAGPLLLYAHGNGELIDHWGGEFEAPRRAGLSVLLVEYPGYGRSSGRPSQTSVAAAMAAAYDWAVRQPGVDPQRIIGYGRSLGGGAACGLARERPVAALVLESTFTSVRDLARALGFPPLLVRDAFDNLAVVRRFAKPVLLLHGERDASIPPSHAALLHRAAPGSELHLLPCGHNDCRRPWPLVQRFLLAHGLL